jgi:hypothetical protein
MEYVSVKYEEQLEQLATVLVTSERFAGSLALAEVVETQLIEEIA